MNRLKKELVAGLAALCATSLFAAIEVQGTIHTETDRKSGKIKWQGSSKTYSVSFKKGKTEVCAEYKLADVVELEIAKPAEFDKAVGMVEGGQASSAIPILTKIVADYRMLVWDKPAARSLVYAYIATGQAQKAYDACKAIIDQDKSAAWSGDLAPAWWQALLKLGKRDQLDEVLRKAAASGSRPTAAAVCVMRGDIIMSEGDSPEIVKRALRDGYLKGALMFADAVCVRERGEAMLKAADCFDKIGQAARAEKLRSQARAL